MAHSLASFLEEAPLTESVDLIIPDLSGIPRGKRMALPELEAALAGKGLFSTTVYALDSTGANVDRSGLVWEEGDADRPLRLDLATLAATPWAPGHAQILGGLDDHDGSPFFADPRRLVTRLAEKLNERGLASVAAMELEFYLLDATPDEHGFPRVPPLARLGRRPREADVYGLEGFDDNADFFDLVEDYGEALSLPIKGALAEFAPGQFEVNLGHVRDPLRAADHALMFKRCVKAAARQCGRQATFMAKPFEARSGNGLHVHLSLEDSHGRNLFGEADDGEVRLRHALGGLMATMPEAMLILAPNPNSYRRFQPLSYAPTAPSWGVNNRTVALRVPAGGPEARRVEHRVAGADANPYLVMAAILAGVLHGLDHDVDPGPPITGNAYARRRRGLPLSLESAIARFRRGRILPDHLGQAFCRLFATCREVELERFAGRITPTEIEWYLSAV